MFDDSRSFITRAFLRAVFELDYRAYTAEQDAELLKRFRDWDGRLPLSETQAEGAFTQTFFVDTWGYGEAGRVEPEEHTAIAKFPIPGEGAGGGAGEADLALGWFRGRRDGIPQVLCEFKDIRSRLDAKQSRKGSTRSPVEQCLNYVRGARRGLFGNESVQPWWGLVTDMNEFRLYWWDRAPSEYIRFFIRREDLLSGGYDLLAETDDARFDRYLFAKLFSRDMLLSEAGRPLLLRLVERQWARGRKLEGEFYDRYKEVREHLYNVLRLNNPSFPGRPGELLRLTQKLLDRFIFAFFCEDMGERMLFPPQMLRDFLKNRSVEPFYDENGPELWDFFRRLFALMNSGGTLNVVKLPEINGGLFAPDPLIDGLSIPNHIFAKAGQGANEASLESGTATLFYLCGRYNYAARGDVKESLSLYTLGHIFEQSITELEYREGELEGRETVAQLSKRKRDGVYYTPEEVVNYLVEQTLGSWFADAKAACGYPRLDEGAPTVAAAAAYVERLRAIRIVDPACGSGAFLISAFRRLLLERIAAARDVERVRGGAAARAIDEPPLIAEILRENIYGVDINPASVEIAKLALWLHSARVAAPLSSLEHTIRIGNSLVGDDFWAGRQRTPQAEERVRTFEWRAAFPEVFPAGREDGFDIVLGNPPYVKLQNLMKVDPDVVVYLSASRGDDTYASAQTGNFDLYLPFIEKGLRLLAPGGRMAFIAPSLWAVNQYGEGLRGLVRRGRHLDRWRDARGAMRLIYAGDMESRFPRAWAHLRRWEQELRKRESNAFDDENWYRFGRSQNIDKQDIAKLIVPRLVQHMKCSLDPDGRFCLDNVDVGGVLPATETESTFLMAVLNAPVCDFVFRIISKPFQNDYRSANKQFIAPLPIPNASAEARADIATRARRMQQRWTERRDLLQEASDRMSVLARARHPARWLWPDLPALPDMAERAPEGLRLASDRRKWAEERLDEMEAAHVEALQAALDRGGRRQVRFERGELRLYVSGAVVLDKIYLDNPAGRLAESYWRWLLLSGPSQEAERFASDLRRPPAPSDSPAAAQFIERVAALAEEVAAIEADERALNETLYGLYRLSPEERNLVENELGSRNVATANG